MGRARVVAALLALILAGCGAPAPAPSIAVGAAPGPESALVAQLYAAALRFYGNPAHVQSVPDPLRALDSGDITVAPASTGRVLERLAPDATARADTQVYRAMVAALPEGVAAGDFTTSAEDKPALAVTETTADAWGGRDVTAAARHCATLRPGAVAGAPVPSALGTCRPAAAREFQDSARLFDALLAGQVNAGWTTTATPDIPDGLITLSDRTSLIRAENLVPLYRRNTLNESQVLALNEVAGVLDTGSLADMRRQVAEGEDPSLVAGQFLDAHPLGD